MAAVRVRPHCQSVGSPRSFDKPNVLPVGTWGTERVLCNAQRVINRARSAINWAILRGDVAEGQFGKSTSRRRRPVVLRTQRLILTPVGVATTKLIRRRGYVSSVSSVLDNRSGGLKSVDVELDGKPTKLLVDTGAKVSILNYATLQKINPQARIEKGCCNLRSYNSPIGALGTTNLNVRYEGICKTGMQFHVVKEGINLLGKDLFDALRFRLLKPSGEQIAAVLLSDYPEVLDRVGCARFYRHEPRIDKSVRPVIQRLRRPPFALTEEISAELNRLEREGIIERIDSSPWVSNLTIALKKNGAIRLCVDLREVNKAVIPDQYPLPTVNELFHTFRGAAVFTKIDLRWGYNQIPLAEDSRQLTAFITHQGLYQYKRMPFGLSSAPAAFQKIIAHIVNGIEGTVNLLDDIVVSGRTQQEHDSRVAELLRRLTYHGLVANDSKCALGVSEIEFYGHKISQAGYEPLQSNASAIREICVPTNADEISRFLGAVQFYGRFIPNLSTINAPLRQLLRKDIPFHWSEQCAQSFVQLRQCLVQAPVLTYFDPARETIVTTDASQGAIGAVLSQRTDDGEKPIAYAHRTLTAAQSAYSATEREALACVWATEYWEYYLYGRPFVLRTDHAALTTLLTCKGTGTGHRPMRLLRWHERLSLFTFRVEHKPGKENPVADLLSRTRTPVSNEIDDIEQSDSEYVFQVLSSFTKLDLLAAETDKDPLLQEVLEYVRTRWPKRVLNPAAVPFFRVRNELKRVGRYLLRGNRIVIPRTLQRDVLETAHEGRLRTNQRGTTNRRIYRSRTNQDAGQKLGSIYLVLSRLHRHISDFWSL